MGPCFRRDDPACASQRKFHPAKFRKRRVARWRRLAKVRLQSARLRAARNSRRKPMIRCVYALLSAVLFVGAAPAQAKDWPVRPVTIIVPFAAGGSTDIVARLMAERFRAAFEGTFIVENRAGATGN